ncbi:hypothetical protein FRB98_001350 [Tulasnella sp. 332]|nr:hypothetical protein FRB98_001350 [Tulasnella sp. 332]
MSLASDYYRHDPSASPLQITAKRYYWRDAAPVPSASWGERYTLVCLNGTGMVKECWEPILESLFKKLSAAGTNNPFIIDEAWAIDWQNHGEAATLNAQLLREPRITAVFEYMDWYPGISDFIVNKIYRPDRKLVGVGHSYGSTALLHLSAEHPTLFTSNILFDTMLHLYPTFEDIALMCGRMFVTFACTRRDVWPSKKAALKDLKVAFKGWDPRQIELFVEHGLVEHPAAKHPYSFKGVTLACTREQEAAIVRGAVNFRKAVCPKYQQVTNTVPTYMCFGEKSDGVPRKCQDALIDPARGRIIQSCRIPDSAHLVVLQQPTACGEALFGFLKNLATSSIEAAPMVSKRYLDQGSSPDSTSGGAVIQMASRL